MKIMRHVSAAVFLAPLAACSAPIDDPAAEIGEADQEIISGTTTCGVPAIGKVLTSTDSCTATLIAPDMILTAAHCFNHGSNESGSAGGYFLINDYGGLCGQSHIYTITRYHSFGGLLGADDVAVAQLNVPVPSSVATPLKIATSMPPVGSAAAIYGHNARSFSAPGTCATTDWVKSYSIIPIDGNVVGNKRITSSPYTGSTCPSDSGGPVFTSNLEIFWVGSAGAPSNTNIDNYFGEAWRWRGSIDAKLAAWSCPGGSYYNGQPVDMKDRYPFANVCGRDGRNYECHQPTHSWRPVGGTCGNTACRCSGGTALFGISIDPMSTSCGSTVCGTDHRIYECTAGGWNARVGSACGY